jgi:alpha-tubulin suppressor-like RCC1 family protein
VAARGEKIELVRAALGLVVLAACGRLGFEATGTVVTGDGSLDADAAPACTIQLGAARQHTTAVSADGSLRVWGYGAYGQIGDGFMMDRAAPTPVALPARTVSANGGRFDTCVALETGTVKCWGEGTSGQLGNGDNVSSATPVDVVGLTGAVEVAVAAVHACARLGNGTVWCWGEGGSGRLGTGDTMSSLVPVQVSGLTTAKHVVAGGSTTCAILDDDTVRCWGFNQQGGVGNNTTTDVLSPDEPIGLGTVRSIATRDVTTCGVTSGRAVMCWGGNGQGQVGTGTVGGIERVPVPVQTASGDLVGADEVGMGIEHGCARLGTEVWCWGRNDSGQLGDGGTGAGRPYAAPVVGLPPVEQLAIGAYTSCAVDTGRGVWCWGLGMNGELGGGTIIAAQPSPAQSFDACP